MTAEDVNEFSEKLQRKMSEEAQEVYDAVFNHFSQMILNNDFVKATRCRDCIYGIENGEWCGQKVYLCSCMTNPNEFYGDFYCAFGEMKEDLTDEINELIGEGFVI